MSPFFRTTACVLLVLSCSISQSQSQGEPAIQSGLSIESYVTDFLLGEGVEVFNIIYSKLLQPCYAQTDSPFLFGLHGFSSHRPTP